MKYADKEEEETMHPRKLLVVLPFLLATMLLTGCAAQASQGPTDLVPVACHKELGVGLLFITVENRGYDAEPSTMTVAFTTHSPGGRQVTLSAHIPAMPSHAQRWVTIDLPSATNTSGFLQPAGNITITVDARKVLPEINRANNMLVTGCNDRT